MKNIAAHSNLPPGFKVVHFAIPAIPGVTAKVTSKGPVSVYSVFFAAGAYIYNVDAATIAGKLSRAQFTAAMTSYYTRVK